MSFFNPSKASLSSIVSTSVSIWNGFCSNSTTRFSFWTDSSRVSCT
jgi:hypothetical protein